MKIVEQINGFGDIICPHCRVNIITKMSYMLVPGIGLCPKCKGFFRLNSAEALDANEKRKLDFLRRCFT